MVSINKNFAAAQPGATFFNSSAEEDGHLVNPSQPAQPHHFVPLKTIKHCALHLLISTTISIVGIVLAVREPDLEHRCRAYFIMLYLHAAFWFFTLITDYILKKTHHNMRISGYLEFYQQTYTLHRAPIYVVSLWNAFLLIIQTLVQHFYPDNFIEQCAKGGFVAPVSYVTGFIWVETVILSAIHGMYMSKVAAFNKSQQRPDVQRDHLVEAANPQQNRTSPLQSTSSPLSQTLTQTADLLARQADLIRHLREHNEKLSNKLSSTTAQLRTLQHQQTTASSQSNTGSLEKSS
ncbi:transmembrane protein 192 isoform X2 [Arctopsyche grandis]|uniref:transmembrane protein 192 isoform X2 n=1 Tax=Arctopsyche grandis TaxID=121162 RepID=UPI00406DA404